MATLVREPPRVAVVTPTLDMARFLGETVESVLSQDYPHLDYLVMDGGSRDGSVELLRGYADRLRFVSEPDAGQADAVNRGFGRTQSDIFTFLNADDTYRRGAVSAAVEALERQPAAGVVYGEADYVDDRGSVVGPYPTRPFDARLLAEECYICQPAAFVRRRVWSAAGGLDARFHFAFDYDLWIRLSRIVPFVHLQRPLATSRMHRQNKTLGSRGAHYREVIAVLKRHYGRVPMRWLDDYAAHLVDGVDQFYEHSHLGRRARGLALA
ncbi:MAG: glycosyltransferase, partial [Actinomycetota bacterium]|nr:glycosyltransferase [Actinomycetota bacterium]